MIGDIFKEMRRQLIGQQKAVTGLPFGTGTYTERPSIDFETLSRDGYEKNALIFACINELASSASEAKAIVEKKNRKDEWEAWPQSRLQKLLDNPSPILSPFHFWFHVILYQSLAGNCYYEKERSGAGLVVGLWLMRPDYVSIKAVRARPGERASRRIQGYEWAGGVDHVIMPYEDVIHFKKPHPRDDLYGFPPLAAAARQGDTDNLATDFVSSFFNNAAVPFGLLKTKGTIDEAERDRVTEFLQRMYGSRGLSTGTYRWHRPLILGDDADWIEMGKSFEDMDFPNLRMITETRICEVFQVPPILVGSYAGTIGTTFENYKEARRSFWLETLMPAYKENADAINLQLTPEFGKDIRVRFDFSAVRALQEAEAAVYTRANESVGAGWLTVNEARSMAGLEEVPDGNVFLRPMMLMPVSAEEKPQAPGAKDLRDIYDAAQRYRKSMGLQDVAYGLPNVAGVKSANIPEEWKEAWAKSIDIVAQAWEGVFDKVATSLLRKEKAELLKILRREGKATKQGDPFEKFFEEGASYLMADRDAWVEEFDPLFAGVMKSQADNILGAYGIAFDITRPEVAEFLKVYTFEFAKGIQGVSEKGLRDLVIKAQAEGWSVPTLRKAIEEDTKHYYDGYRATRIARTETIRSSNAGAEEAWKEAGIEKKQWYATLDGRQCPECEAEYEHSKDNPTIMGGNFQCGLDFPPLHPNCRCTILAYFEEA